MKAKFHQMEDRSDSAIILMVVHAPMTLIMGTFAIVIFVCEIQKEHVTSGNQTLKSQNHRTE